MNTLDGFVSQIFLPPLFLKERLCFEEKCLRLTLGTIGFELFIYLFI